MYTFADAPYPGDLHWFHDYDTPVRAGFAVMDDFGTLAVPDSIYARTFCINR